MRISNIAITLAFIYFMAAPVPVFGDDTFIYDNGHSVYPINTDKVRMASEVIRVIMGEDDAHVDCEFLFENTTQNEVSAKLGFPSFEHSPELIGRGPEPGQLRNFTSSINGQNVKVQLKNELLKKYDPVLKESYDLVRPWHIWNVVFPPLQTITIKNSYDVSLSINYYNRWFEYILTTGANWKGPIGHAVIEVEYKDANNLRKRLIKASPPNFTISGNKITWDFTNLVPKENIKVYNAVYMAPPISSALWEFMKTKRYEADKRLYSEADIVVTKNEELWKRLSFHKEYYVGNIAPASKFVYEMQKIYARLLRNEIYARHGKIFKSDDLKSLFSGCKWYKEDQNYNDQMLNETERQNLKYIQALEKKQNTNMPVHSDAPKGGA